MRPRPCKWWCSPFAKGDLRLQAKCSEFTGQGQSALPVPQARLRLVDTVPAISPSDPTKTRRQWPDILRDLPAEGFVVPPKQARGLWLAVSVPAQTAPGEYRATVTVSEAGGGQSLSLPVSVRVHDLLLPEPSAWELRVDFWQGFSHLARRYQVPEWSEEWWALVRTFVQDLADHGQSVVQVGRGHFDWRKDADGNWNFGFARFDRYVELCDSVGIRGLIEYLQMFDGRADTRLSWSDAEGKTQTVTANPGDPAFDELWTAFARALAQHCREKGWLDRLYICPTDEPQDVYGPPTLERYRRCVALLKRADRAHRVTAAMDSLAAARDLADVTDRFVFKLRADVYDAAWAKSLRQSGKLVEAYICCHPDRPNSFITSAPVEQRAIGWICRQEGFQGLLRWSYVNWPPDPFGRPEGDGKYAPGDLFIVYPGDRQPLASTRWERMRDGFEDFEMLRAAERAILKAPESPEKTAAQQAMVRAYAQVVGPPGSLTSYATDPRVLLDQRAAILDAVANLKPLHPPTGANQ